MFRCMLAIALVLCVARCASADDQAPNGARPQATEVDRLTLPETTKYKMKFVATKGGPKLQVVTGGKEYLAAELRIKQDRLWQVFVPIQGGAILPVQMPFPK